MTRPHRQARRRRHGFTLMDIAVVLAITVIGTMLVVPQWRSIGGVADEPDSVVTTPANAKGLAPLLDLLAASRRRAIAHRQEVRVYVVPATRVVHVDTAGLSGLGTWVETALPASVGQLLDDGPAILTAHIHPSGATIADIIRLRLDGRLHVVQFDPWSGEVLVHVR